MLLEVRDIRKSFGEKEILHGISFQIQSGRAMGFLGRNGAGKSTTFRCLMQVFRQDSGEFLLDGAPLRLSEHRVGYLPEERGMYSKVTIFDQLVYFAQLKGADKKQAQQDASYWIHYFDLDDYKNKPLETLSKGNQQKIQIAQAFLHDPDIIILDEPFSGLDPVNAKVFTSAIREMVGKGRLVIFSSHQMAYVEELCDDITLIHQGTIQLTGSLEKIKEQKGEHKFFVEPQPGQMAFLEERLTQAGLSFTGQRGRLIVSAASAPEVEKLRGVFSENFGRILSSGFYRPLLEDIFIEYEGEENELV